MKIRITPNSCIFASSSINHRMLNIVLFGPPGAGKGTQSEKLIDKYRLVHLSTGDIFRSNIKGETELGNLAKSYMDKGELVPDSVTISMLQREVEKYPEAKGFIFDGFPRTSAQAEALDTFLQSKNTAISCMLALEVEEEELIKRLLNRAKTSGRADDADEAIVRNRISVYNRETAPVADFYKAQGKYRGIAGMGSVEEIFDRLCAAVNTITV
jgi:adenylate kinase